MITREACDALIAAALRMTVGPDENRRDIDAALIEWAFEDAPYQAEDSNGAMRDAVDRLNRCDCAGVYAPGGLVYNHDLAAKAFEWWGEIDEAFSDYLDATGSPLLPGEGKPITIGWMVWAAVEWRAYELANLLDGRGDEIVDEVAFAFDLEDEPTARP